MKFKDVCIDLRKKAGLSQNDVADRLFVTRQAVSRWERGETVPETETLLALSRLFGVSINTLLGSPPYAGMPELWNAPERRPAGEGARRGVQ